MAREPANKAQSAKLSERITNMEVKFVETHTVKSTIREQLARAKRRITALETHLDKARLTHEKLADDLSITESNFTSQVVAVEVLLNVERVA